MAAATQATPSRLGLAAPQMPNGSGALLDGTAKLLSAVSAAGAIDRPSWGQRIRHYGGTEVFQQLWERGREWPTSSRMWLYATGLRHERVRPSHAVLAAVAADLTAAMIRDPERAHRDHIRYIVHGCLEAHLRRRGADAAGFAEVYLAAWERAAGAVPDEAHALLLWRVMARTVQRAPRYWPSGTLAAMVPAAMAAALDGGEMPPTPAAALVCTVHCAGVGGVAERVVAPLRRAFIEHAAARPAWRLTLADALADVPWPADLPRLSDAERRLATHALWAHEIHGAWDQASDDGGDWAAEDEPAGPRSHQGA